MSDIKPAMNAEEWADPDEVFDGVINLDAGIVDVRLGAPAGIRDESRERHALAARLLADQPFGFNQEDVDRMKWLESGQEVCPKCGGSNWKLPARPICTGCGWRPHESSENLTDRIQALLPKVD